MVQISLRIYEVRKLAGVVFTEALGMKSFDTQNLIESCNLLAKFQKVMKGDDKRIIKQMFNRIVSDNKLPMREYKITVRKQ